MTSSKTVTILLLCCLLSLSFVESGSEAEIIKALEETQREEVAWKHIPLSGPSFDGAFAKNVTIQIGKTAILNCRIKYLGGKTVSWMRVRDLHLLTVGRFTYTSDERFRAIHTPGSDDWLLKIHYAQIRDVGAYECQVSTTPPISTTVWLNVVAEPETEVLGGPDLFINSGSTINLTCVVNHSPEPAPHIYWYHQSEQLFYDSPRGGITVVTEHGPTSSSRLLIQKATDKDAGEYSCRPANAEPHYINVHIFPNELPAAIHHKNGTSGSLSIHQGIPSHYSFILSIILSILTLCPNFIIFCGFCAATKIPNIGIIRKGEVEKDFLTESGRIHHNYCIYKSMYFILSGSSLSLYRKYKQISRELHYVVLICKIVRDIHNIKVQIIIHIPIEIILYSSVEHEYFLSPKKNKILNARHIHFPQERNFRHFFAIDHHTLVALILSSTCKISFSSSIKNIFLHRPVSKYYSLSLTHKNNSSPFKGKFVVLFTNIHQHYYSMTDIKQTILALHNMTPNPSLTNN